jgi:hypothetical protein
MTGHRGHPGGEAGLVEAFVAGVITFALLGAFLAPAVISDIYDLTHPAPPVPGAPSGTGPPLSLYVGPGLPAFQEECAQNVAAQYGLQWVGGSQGWRAAAYPPPALTGDRSVDHGAVAAWQEQMSTLTGPASAKWAEVCGKSVPQGAPTPSSSTPPPPALPIDGPYAVTIGDASAGCTTSVQYDSMNVSHGAGTVTIVVSGSGGSGTLTGALHDDDSFDATLNDQGIIVDMSGMFTADTSNPDGSTVVAVNHGVFNIENLNCTVTFVARHR